MYRFKEMQAGRTDRSVYAPAFFAQVTDEAVGRMSHDLNAHGASPNAPKSCRPDRTVSRPSTR